MPRWFAQVVNDNQHATTIDYDTAHRRRAITDARGNVVTYTYDPNSNVTAIGSLEKDDLGGPDQSFGTTYAYDNLNRIIRETDQRRQPGPFPLRFPQPAGAVGSTGGVT
jgi:YD repeat-containing protein